MQWLSVYYKWKKEKKDDIYWSKQNLLQKAYAIKLECTIFCFGFNRLFSCKNKTQT